MEAAHKKKRQGGDEQSRHEQPEARIWYAHAARGNGTVNFHQ